MLNKMGNGIINREDIWNIHCHIWKNKRLSLDKQDINILWYWANSKIGQNHAWSWTNVQIYSITLL